MDEPPSIVAAAAVHDFLLRYLADREQGNEVTLEEYLELFPGYQEEITRKHHELRAEERAIPPQRERERDPDDSPREILRRLTERGEGHGRYEVEGEVARGGQGIVLRVWDEDLHRQLAMKVILGEERAPDTDSQALGRFLEEAQVTGQLDHPGVVPIHELGLDAEGRVYFTMKLVKGRDLKSIFKLVREGKEGWTQTRALNVMLRVCEAMAYAHSKGVIHRDLKPSNVMVGKYGEVYVMDWGLARVSSKEDRKDVRIRPETLKSDVRSSRRAAATDLDSPLLTMDGDVVGTPAYMSPEQASGDLEAMGPHSDVYAAGAMLYHLLAGRMPYVPSGSRLNNYAVWYQVQKGPPEPLRDLAPEAPAELVAICEKAMSRERGPRYADMSELAEDLRAYLEHRVVGAYRTGAVAELKKWVERNKVLATTAAAAAMALVLATALYVSSLSRAQAETEEALRQTRALGLAGASDEALESDTMLALLLAREAVRVDRTPETLSRLHQALGAVRERRVFRHTAEFVDAVFSPAGDKLVGTTDAMALLWDLDATEPAGEPVRLEGHGAWLTSASFSPSGQHVLTSSQDGTARLWDLDGKQLASFGHDMTVWTAALSPDERYVLTASQDGTAKLWDRDEDETPLADLEGHTGAVRAASFSPDGETLLTASVDGTGRLWRFDEELGAVECIAVLEGHEGPITCASFSPAGDRIVTASGEEGIWAFSGAPDDTARIWDLEGEELALLEGHTDGVEWAVFSPDGGEILTASSDQTGRRWDLEGRLLGEYRVPSVIWRCSFSPDGRFVAFGCANGTAWLFDVSGKLIGPLSGHDSPVNSVRFSPSSRSIATASLDKTVRLWSVLDDAVPTYYGHRGELHRAVYSPDGTRVATVSADREVRVWDVWGSERPIILRGHRRSVFSVEFSHDGQRLVTASRDLTARVWDLRGGEEPRVFPHGPGVRMVTDAAFSPDGERIVTGCRDGSLKVWDVETGTLLESFGVMGMVEDVAIAPDGEQLLVARWYSGPVLLVSLRDVSKRIELGCEGVRAVFAPGGDRILIASEDGKAILTSRAGDVLGEFGGHEGRVNSASFSRDGERIVTASMDGTARVWDADGTLRATLRGHTGGVSSAVFSPRGDRVLTASRDGTARTWIVDSDELVRFAEQRSIRSFLPGELLKYEDLLDVPAEEARDLVDAMFDELLLKDRVVERLERDRGLDGELRSVCLRFANALVDPSAMDLLSRASTVVNDPDQTEDAYARALYEVDAAHELDADNPYLRICRGSALYRMERFEEALEELALADHANRALTNPAYNPAFDALYLAMAHERLGQPRQVTEQIERARELILAETNPSTVEELSGLLREVEQLIEEGKR